MNLTKLVETLKSISKEKLLGEGLSDRYQMGRRSHNQGIRNKVTMRGVIGRTGRLGNILAETDKEVEDKKDDKKNKKADKIEVNPTIPGLMSPTQGPTRTPT